MEKFFIVGSEKTNSTIIDRIYDITAARNSD
jgi:hypothetical protein